MWNYLLIPLSQVCPRGLGLESHSAMPASIKLSASSEAFGKPASNGRLNNNETWCSSTVNNTEYLFVDLGKLATVTGIAIQGDPNGTNWVKTFSIKYGSSVTSMEIYQENGIGKVCCFI